MNDVLDYRVMAANLVRNYRDYVGLSAWAAWATNHEIEVPNAERIAEAILNLPNLPPRWEDE